MGIPDWLIGDSFMRNIYSLYDYGNQTSQTDGNPYMQILSVCIIVFQFSQFF